MATRPRKIRDQASKRRSVQMRDQHGRTWAFTIDTDTMTPVGMGGWVDWAPPELPDGKRLIPPMRVLSFDPERIGELRIDYEAWKASLERADDDWQQNLSSQAIGMYGDKAAEAIANPSRELLIAVGARPFPVELVEACEDEDPWALGLQKPGRGGRTVPRAEPPEDLAAVLAQMAPTRRSRRGRATEAEATTT